MILTRRERLAPSLVAAMALRERWVRRVIVLSTKRSKVPGGAPVGRRTPIPEPGYLGPVVLPGRRWPLCRRDPAAQPSRPTIILPIGRCEARTSAPRPKGTWVIRQVDDVAWERLRGPLRDEYLALRGAPRSLSTRAKDGAMIAEVRAVSAPGAYHGRTPRPMFRSLPLGST